MWLTDELDPAILQTEDKLAPLHDHLNPRPPEEDHGIHRHHAYLNPIAQYFQAQVQVPILRPNRS